MTFRIQEKTMQMILTVRFKVIFWNFMDQNCNISIRLMEWFLSVYFWRCFFSFFFDWSDNWHPVCWHVWAALSDCVWRCICVCPCITSRSTCTTSGNVINLRWPLVTTHDKISSAGSRLTINTRPAAPFQPCSSPNSHSRPVSRLLLS